MMEPRMELTWFFCTIILSQLSGAFHADSLYVINQLCCLSFLICLPILVKNAFILVSYISST